MYGFILVLYDEYNLQLIPVATQSKAWVCGCLLDGIVGLNPTEHLVVCLL